MHECEDLTVRVFTIAITFIAAASAVAGGLALLATSGRIPLESIALGRLTSLGAANCYGLVIGGIALFILGTAAWACHLRNVSYQQRLTSQSYLS